MFFCANGREKDTHVMKLAELVISYEESIHSERADIGIPNMSDFVPCERMSD